MIYRWVMYMGDGDAASQDMGFEGAAIPGGTPGGGVVGSGGGSETGGIVGGGEDMGFEGAVVPGGPPGGGVMGSGGGSKTGGIVGGGGGIPTPETPSPVDLAKEAEIKTAETKATERQEAAREAARDEAMAAAQQKTLQQYRAEQAALKAAVEAQPEIGMRPVTIPPTIPTPPTPPRPEYLEKPWNDRMSEVRVRGNDLARRAENLELSESERQAAKTELSNLVRAIGGSPPVLLSITDSQGREALVNLAGVSTQLGRDIGLPPVVFQQVGATPSQTRMGGGWPSAVLSGAPGRTGVGIPSQEPYFPSFTQPALEALRPPGYDRTEEITQDRLVNLKLNYAQGYNLNSNEDLLRFIADGKMDILFQQQAWLTPVDFQIMTGVTPAPELMTKLQAEGKSYTPKGLFAKELASQGFGVGQKFEDRVAWLNSQTWKSPLSFMGEFGDWRNYGRYGGPEGIPRDKNFTQLAEIRRYILGWDDLLSESTMQPLKSDYVRMLQNTPDKTGAIQGLLIAPLLRGAEKGFEKHALDNLGVLRPISQLDINGNWTGLKAVTTTPKVKSLEVKEVADIYTYPPEPTEEEQRQMIQRYAEDYKKSDAYKQLVNFYKKVGMTTAEAKKESGAVATSIDPKDLYIYNNYPFASVEDVEDTSGLDEREKKDYLDLLKQEKSGKALWSVDADRLQAYKDRISGETVIRPHMFFDLTDNDIADYKILLEKWMREPLSTEENDRKESYESRIRKNVLAQQILQKVKNLEAAPFYKEPSNLIVASFADLWNLFYKVYDIPIDEQRRLASNKLTLERFKESVIKEMSEKGGLKGGEYDIAGKKIRVTAIPIASTYSDELVGTVAHEYAHDYWFEQLSKEQKESFINDIKKIEQNEGVSIIGKSPFVGVFGQEYWESPEEVYARLFSELSGMGNYTSYYFMPKIPTDFILKYYPVDPRINGYPAFKTLEKATLEGVSGVPKEATWQDFVNKYMEEYRKSDEYKQAVAIAKSEGKTTVQAKKESDKNINLGDILTGLLTSFSKIGYAVSPPDKLKVVDDGIANDNRGNERKVVQYNWEAYENFDKTGKKFSQAIAIDKNTGEIVAYIVDGAKYNPKGIDFTYAIPFDAEHFKKYGAIKCEGEECLAKEIGINATIAWLNEEGKIGTINRIEPKLPELTPTKPPEPTPTPTPTPIPAKPPVSEGLKFWWQGGIAAGPPEPKDFWKAGYTRIATLNEIQSQYDWYKANTTDKPLSFNDWKTSSGMFTQDEFNKLTDKPTVVVFTDNDLSFPIKDIDKVSDGNYLVINTSELVWGAGDKLTNPNLQLAANLGLKISANKADRSPVITVVKNGELLALPDKQTLMPYNMASPDVSLSVIKDLMSKGVPISKVSTTVNHFAVGVDKYMNPSKNIKEKNPETAEAWQELAKARGWHNSVTQQQVLDWIKRGDTVFVEIGHIECGACARMGTQLKAVHPSLENKDVKFVYVDVQNAPDLARAIYGMSKLPDAGMNTFPQVILMQNGSVKYEGLGIPWSVDAESPEVINWLTSNVQFILGDRVVTKGNPTGIAIPQELAKAIVEQRVAAIMAAQATTPDARAEAEQKQQEAQFNLDKIIADLGKTFGGIGEDIKKILTPQPKAEGVKLAKPTVISKVEDKPIGQTKPVTVFEGGVGKQTEGQTVTFAWKTNNPTIGQVMLCDASGVCTYSPATTKLSTTHSVTMDVPYDAKYHVTIKSIDETGNEIVSEYDKVLAVRGEPTKPTEPLPIEAYSPSNKLSTLWDLFYKTYNIPYSERQRLYEQKVTLVEESEKGNKPYGEYSIFSKNITFKPTQSILELVPVLAHEYAHDYWVNVLNPDKRGSFLLDYDKLIGGNLSEKYDALSLDALEVYAEVYSMLGSPKHTIKNIDSAEGKEFIQKYYPSSPSPQEKPKILESELDKEDIVESYQLPPFESYEDEKIKPKPTEPKPTEPKIAITIPDWSKVLTVDQAKKTLDHYKKVLPSGDEVYDIISAIRDGASTELIKSFFDSEDITKAQKKVEQVKNDEVSLGKYKSVEPDGTTKYDLIKAIENGVPDDLLRRNFEPSVIDDARSRLAELKTDQNAIVKYKVILPNGEEGYDLIAALRGGISESTLEKYFDKDKVDEAQQALKEEERSALVQVKILEDRWIWKPTDEIISSEERDRLISEKASNRDLIIKYQPALVLALDPEWQNLKDKPDNDPDKIAWFNKWSTKVIDTAAFAALVATPWTVPAVGVVGKGFATLLGRGAALATQYAVKPVAMLSPKLAPLLSVTPGVSSAVVSLVPRMATAMVQILTWGMPTAHLAGRMVDEVNLSGKFQKDWDDFKALPVLVQDEYTRNTGYNKDFKELNDEQQSVVLLNYSKPVGAVENWTSTIGQGLDKIEKLASQGAENLQKKAPAPVTLPIVLLGGTMLGVIEGLGYTANMPILATHLIHKIPTGTAAAYANDVLTGMGDFFTKVLPNAVMANPALGTGRIAGIFLFTPLSFAKFVKGLGYDLPRATVKGLGGAIAIEWSTLRTPPLDKIAARYDLGHMNLLKTGEYLVKQLVTKGIDKAKVQIGDFVVKVKSVPWQQVIGDTYFHFTVNKEPWAKGEPVYRDKITFSPQAGERFGELTSKGKVSENPAVIVLHVSPQYKPKLEKFLAGKSIELETWFRRQWFEPIQGPSGQGIYVSPITGKTYPTYHFTLRGDATQWKGVSLKDVIKIQSLVAKNATLDFFLGWGGRLSALREKFGTPSFVKRADSAIDKLKNAPPEVVHSGDVIVRQRSEILHPEGGTIVQKVRGILRHPNENKILLVNDRADAKGTYGLPGGSINVNDWIVVTPQGPKWVGDVSAKQRPKPSWADALISQIWGELDVGAGNVSYMGMYKGKVGEHALVGARVYELKAESPNVNTRGAWEKWQKGKYKYAEPEVRDAIWWDGKTEITVHPYTYDVLNAVAKKYGLDMSKVRIDTSNSSLLKFRDTKFAERFQSGRDLSVTPQELNKADIAWLKHYKNQELAKMNAPATIVDYLTAEPDMKFILTVLKGARKAVELEKVGVSKASDLKLLLEWLKQIHADEKGSVAMDILSEKIKSTKTDTATLTKAEKSLVKKEVDKIIESKEAEFEASLKEIENYSYRYSADTVRKQYVNMLTALDKSIYRSLADADNISGVSLLYDYMSSRKLPKTQYVYETKTPEYKSLVTEYGKPYKFDKYDSKTHIGYSTYLRTDYPTFKPPDYPPHIPPTYLPFVPPTYPLIKVPPYPSLKIPPYPPFKIPKEPPKIMPLAKYASLTNYQKLASIAWRQGFVYILWYPPFHQDSVIFSRDPIPGVKYHTGYRSAYKSVARVMGEYLPREIKREMGFEQVGAKVTHRKAEPTLTFRTIEPKVRREIKRGRKPRQRVYNNYESVSMAA